MYFTPYSTLHITLIQLQISSSIKKYLTCMNLSYCWKGNAVKRDNQMLQIHTNTHTNCTYYIFLSAVMNELMLSALSHMGLYLMTCTSYSTLSLSHGLRSEKMHHSNRDLLQAPGEITAGLLAVRVINHVSFPTLIKSGE